MEGIMCSLVVRLQLSWRNQIIFISSQFGSDLGKTTEGLAFDYEETMTND